MRLASTIIAAFALVGCSPSDGARGHEPNGLTVQNQSGKTVSAFQITLGDGQILSVGHLQNGASRSFSIAFRESFSAHYSLLCNGVRIEHGSGEASGGVISNVLAVVGAEGRVSTVVNPRREDMSRVPPPPSPK